MTVIGVPLRPFTGSGFPPKLALNRAYFDALEAAGATALSIPIVHDPRHLRVLYELLDGLLLPGGADVEPGRYGAVAREDCNLTLMPDLDEVELTLAKWAIEDDLPLLAICRGIQVLNVACGGTLWQDLHVQGVVRESHDRDPRDFLAHSLEIEPGTILTRVAGATRIQVNSLHHQAIREPGTGLRVVARSSDGLIEGVEASGHRFAIGIQCHPEELVRTQPWAARLFGALVQEARQFRESRGLGKLERAMGIEPT
ncbi:MAG: gamma-glutamyl-gamma-aminobutyrate hydrolase family protein [Candidatus Dormiibacterota bacterium]